MANTFQGGRVTGLVELPAASATVIEAGDLCYWDAGNFRVDPFSAQADNGDEESNQAEAAVNFLGRAYTASNDGDTTVVVDTGLARLVLDMPCVSATYRFGTLLGPSEAAGGTSLEDQQLEAVGSYDLATHIVFDDDSAARTTVTCAQIRSYVDRVAPRRRKDVNTETLAGDKTMTHDDPEVHFLDPGGAGRNVDLPPEEESAGLSFVIVNTADAAEVLTIRNDAAGTICTPTQNETARLFCDGTTWAGMVGDNA